LSAGLALFLGRCYDLYIRTESRGDASGVYVPGTGAHDARKHLWRAGTLRLPAVGQTSTDIPVSTEAVCVKAGQLAFAWGIDRKSPLSLSILVPVTLVDFGY
jgi:hypothetical protein